MEIQRGPNFQATFKCATTLSTLDAAVYISAAGTVAEVATNTSYAIGTVSQKSSGAAGDADTGVGVNLFVPTRKGICGGTVTAGLRIMQQTSTAKFINLAGTLTAVHAVGIAVTSAGVDGEKFEFIPLIGQANGIAIA